MFAEGITVTVVKKINNQFFKQKCPKHVQYTSDFFLHTSFLCMMLTLSEIFKTKML